MPSIPAPITSRANPRVKALRAALSGEARRPGDLLGLEGEHLIREAHRSGLEIESVFVRQGSEGLFAQDWVAELGGGSPLVLSRDVFDGAASTPSPQGIMATWRIREPESQGVEGPVLVLEDVQDPGNVGTLIRTAEAFGSSHVMVTAGTANQWSPKVLRASAGSVFRMPVRRAPLEDLAAELRAAGTRVFAAAGELGSARPTRDGTGESAAPSSPPFALDLRGRCAFLIGNEGAGLSQEARALADATVQIPCAVESLNAAVAGAVLLYEAMRQRVTGPL